MAPLCHCPLKSATANPLLYASLFICAWRRERLRFRIGRFHGFWTGQNGGEGKLNTSRLTKHSSFIAANTLPVGKRQLPGPT